MISEKFTKGDWAPVFNEGKCLGVGVVSGNAFSEIICSSILPDNDQEYAEHNEEITANMKLMAKYKQMYLALKLIESGLSELGPRQIAKAALK